MIKQWIQTNVWPPISKGLLKMIKRNQFLTLSVIIVIIYINRSFTWRFLSNDNEMRWDLHNEVYNIEWWIGSMSNCPLRNRFPLQYRSVHFFISRFHIRGHSLSCSGHKKKTNFSKWTIKNHLFLKKNWHSGRENFKIFWKAGHSGIR